MTRYLQTADEYLSNANGRYGRFIALATAVLVAAPFTLVSSDHVSDVAHSLLAADPGLVDAVANVDDAEGAQLIFMGATVLRERDPVLFEKPDELPDFKLRLYQLWLTVAGQNPNVSERARKDDWRWFDIDRGDVQHRRRLHYRLRHEQAEKAANKKAKAA